MKRSTFPCHVKHSLQRRIDLAFQICRIALRSADGGFDEEKSVNCKATDKEEITRRSALLRIWTEVNI